MLHRIPAAAAMLLAAPALAQPVTTHPRLWLRDADVPRLRSWASPANPVWDQGLALMASRARDDMDAGLVPGQDDGGFWQIQYPTEAYAEVFAFMSLVDPDPVARADWATRARTLLMYVIDQAALGAATGVPFRDPRFSTSTRAFAWGEAFPLTTDWIYPSLTTADKAKIRTVFLRWIGENLVATTTTHNHPVPVGVVNDPVLLSHPEKVRWSGNNFYTSHMRNIGLMSLCLDAADDPGGQLRAYLGNATGAWLYVVDHMMRHHIQGGLPGEGMMYGHGAMAYVAELLLALKTAGEDDPARWGPQVVLDANPWWGQLVPAFLSNLSPDPFTLYSWMGPVYWHSYYGDGNRAWSVYWVALFSSLGLHDQMTGNTARLEAARWIIVNAEQGGQQELLTRINRSMSYSGSGRDGILYFMMLDPSAAPPVDPRPTLPLTHEAPGLGRLLSRTAWTGDGTWVTYKLSWNDIDHQHGDGNMFEIYRDGEWLTKERTGYGYEIGCSDYHNTLALENDEPPQNPPGSMRYINWERGSQWAYSGGDPTVLARSLSRDFLFVTGDATNLYNSVNNQSTDILHASRSLMWVKPDHVVVYDRAASATAGRFKRFWLNLPASPSLAGNRATMTLPSGQSLSVRTLQPAGAIVTSELAEPLPGQPAEGEPMTHRLRVEAAGGPASTRFLHVLQGVDAGGAEAPVAALASSAGNAFTGAEVGATAVLFPVDLSTPLVSTTYAASTAATRHLVTGLVPFGGYTAAYVLAGGQLQVTLTPGGPEIADVGGVLDLHPFTCGTITVAPGTLPPGTLGSPYSQQLAATGGVAPHTFAVGSGTLPPGLALATSGNLSGTPAAAGVFPFTVRATDAIACAGVAPYVVIVNAPGCPAITISPASLPDGVLGAPYAAQLTAGGGTAPYVFSLASGTLPPGLTLSAAGAISGSPQSEGTFPLSIVARDAAGCHGLRSYVLQVGARVDHVVGMGLGQPNANRVRVHRADGSHAGVDFHAFGAGQWGVNAAAGNVDAAGSDDVLAAPGPGPIFGPQVRGFRRDGVPMGKINFYAYGTLRFGANVASARLDADAAAEILTGPGPGVVFGPHVRGFDAGSGPVAPMPGVSYYAYATLRYGVNVGAGSIDADGFDEILTGPGPGVVFGAQVRGWNADGGSVTPLAKVSFNAFATGQYGAAVAAGDADGDAFAEIVASPGAGPALPAQVRGFDYDATAVAAAPGFDVVPFATAYGARPAAGDLDGDRRSDLVAGAGRDPAASSLVLSYTYTGSSLLERTQSFIPFGASAYGASTAAGRLGY